GSFAVSACAKSTTDLRLTVTGGVANDTNVTLTLSYDASASTADSLDDDDSNAVIDMTSLSLADSASPVLVSQSYKDINSDGTVDRADLTFSENIAIDECDVGDYTFAGTDSGTIAVQSAGCATSGDDLRLTLENATSLDTSLTFTIAYTASAGTANSLDDSSGNAVADISASSLADAAAPVLRTDGGNQPAYQDINSDGTIDRAILVFTETVTVTYSDGDWTATANDLTSFDTTGYTSGNGSETIYLTATAQAGLTGVGVGTEPSIAFTASTGSIVDPSANAISSFSASILADQADAVVLSQDYNDINGDGVVDRFDVMFSEVITLNECEAGDYTLGGADVGSFAVGSCATSGAELRLTVTGGPSSDTSLTLTLAYTAANGTADSIEDSASRAVSDISALTLADGAAPVPTTYSYLDVDADGVVDRLDVTFTENIAYDECEAGDYTIGGADAGSLAVSACATSGDDLRLTMTGGASDDTSLTLVFSYSQSAGTASSLDDSSGNYAVSITTESVSDGAAPVAISAEYLDTDADGTVNRVDVTFSEAVTLGSYVAGDWSFPEGSELTLVDTGASASSSEIQLTVSADSNETSHTTTPTVSYTNAGNRLSDGTNNTATFASAVNVSDAAAPVAISAEYLDTDVDGDVDRVDVTFTEAVTLSSYNASDWSFPVAGDVTLADTNASASSSEIQITVSSDSYETGHSTAPTVTYTNNSNRLSDGTNNTATFGSAITVSDAAAPVLRTDGSNAARYQDTDANGVIDAVQLIFTENTTLTYDDADWTATANSLSSFDVSAITSGSGSTTIVLTGAAAANTTGVSGATEPTLAFSDATNLTDGTNALTSISSFSLVDAASPIRVSQSYKDIDVDGTVDRLDVTFSENIAYDECDTADYTISGADVGSMAVSACAASTTDLRLTVTGATADDTSMTLTLAYTAANGTADSLDDGTPANAVGDLTASSISDAAAPVAISAEYLDTNTNGTVDRVDVTFTEAVTLDSYVAGDWSFPESSELTLADTGASASGSEIQIAVSADSNETGHTTAPTVSYTNAGNRLNDGTNNTATFASAITLTDGAGAMIISTTPTANEEDVASDTSIVLTFTEAINTATDSIGVTGHSGTFTTVWSSGDTVATLTSNKIYGSAEEITVTITTASDGSSNTFAGMISGTNPFSFTSITLGSSDASLSSAVPTGQYYTLTITQSGSSASISSISLGDSIDISWTDNGYVDSSDVYYRLSSTSAYTFIANTTSDELTWSVPTDEGGNSLKLKVVNGDNNSYSKTASISIASTDDSSSSDGDEGSESSSTSTVFESLVKTTEGSEVYALFPDGTRRVFINSTSYFTWEDTFSAVDTVEPEVMGDYRLTGLMLPRAGTVLVKIQSIPAVYYLEENPDNLYAPILRWIPDEETAIELFGTDWSKLVVDVAPTFFTKFTSPTSPITVEDDDWIDTDAIRTRESLAL
ncbi:hypothetical protein HOI18_00285, partial [Candidatus Uhrbacteria bacterium]|nr:hypothetical protein [Candidatus Uhrbacteria bacterium]